MVDTKRVAYLLIMALVLGVGLVYLQTSRYQMVDRLIDLQSEEEQVRQTVLLQQVELSSRLENPEQMRQMLAKYKVPVLAQGQEEMVWQVGVEVVRAE